MCVCVCMSEYVFACVCVCMSEYICIHVLAYLFAFLVVFGCVWVWVYERVSMCVPCRGREEKGQIPNRNIMFVIVEHPISLRPGKLDDMTYANTKLKTHYHVTWLDGSHWLQADTLCPYKGGQSCKEYDVNYL